MRTVSYLAIVSGLCVLLIAVAAPFILEWEATRILERYGSADYAPLLVSQQMEALQTGRIMSGALATFAVLAGVLILRRKKLGLGILIAVSASFVALSVSSLVLSEQTEILVSSIVRGGWWLFVMLFAVAQSRRSRDSWWA